jgi:hypothetical protein
VRHVVLTLLVIGCRHELPPSEEPPAFTARVVDGGAEPPPAIPVDLEVTTSVADAKRDPKLGTTIVTAAAGGNAGVRPDWIGNIIDERGATLGTFTVMEVTSRTTTGATSLPPDKVTGKRVRLTTPPRP